MFGLSDNTQQLQHEDENIIKRYNKWQNDSINKNNIPFIGFFIDPSNLLSLSMPKLFGSIHLLRHISFNFRYNHGQDIATYFSYPIYQVFLNQASDQFKIMGYYFTVGVGLQVYVPSSKSSPNVYKPYFCGSFTLLVNIPNSFLKKLKLGGTNIVLAFRLDVGNSLKSMICPSIGIQQIRNQKL